VWETNLTFVTPLLAVGGRFPTVLAEDLARDLGIRAVVDLRSEARDEEAILLRHGLAFLHMPTDDHCAVSQAMLDAGVAFAKRHLDRGERVLVHCEHGIGRSALLALCILVGEGLEPLRALEIAKTKRPLVSPSPAQYEAWIQWLERRREVQAASWPIPDFDAFKAIAYRHLRGTG
jgi:protein-tyrosine phosphatase